MAGGFDPYHRWLGIGPEHQPPDHYRLLGIARFESDRQVIDSVALRHISFLQEITDGPCVDQAQQLLNELAAARRCLLDPQRKAAYDAELQARLEQETSPSASSSAAVEAVRIQPVQTPLAARGRGDAGGRAARKVRNPASRRRKDPSTAWYAAAWRRIRQGPSGRWRGLIWGAAAASLLLMLVAWWSGGQTEREGIAVPDGPGSLAEQPLSDAGSVPAGPVSEPDRPRPPFGSPVTKPAGSGEAGGDTETWEADSRPEPAAIGKAPPPADPPTSTSLPSPSAETIVAPAESQAVERLDEPARMASPPATDDAESAARSSLPLPLQIEGLVLWLDAADPATVRTDAAGRIHRWDDKSRQGFAAEVDSDGRGPTWSPEGTPPAIRFDGSEHLTLARTSNPLNLDAEYTWLFVAGGVDGGLMSKGSGESGGSFVLTGSRLSVGGADYSDPGDRGSEMRVRAVVADTRRLRWYVDGQARQVHEGADHAIRTPGVLRLGCVWQRTAGAEQFFRGELAELLIFDRALSAGERDRLERYLRDKWWSDPQSRPPLVFPSLPPEALETEVGAGASGEGAADAADTGREDEETVQEHLDFAAQEPDDQESSGEEGEWPEEGEEPADAPIVWHINLGGEGYEDAQGNRWLQSPRFDGQKFGHEGGRLASGGAPLYPDHRWAETAIRNLTAFRAVLPNGSYEVTFCFCEHWTTDPDRRVFLAVLQRGMRNSIRLNFHGPGMAPELGVGKPWTHTIRRVAVSEGSLDIEFTPLTPDSLPILNAIIIRQLRARRSP